MFFAALVVLLSNHNDLNDHFHNIELNNHDSHEYDMQKHLDRFFKGSFAESSVVIQDFSSNQTRYNYSQKIIRIKIF